MIKIDVGFSRHLSFPTFQLMWRVLHPLWAPLPFVWGGIVMGVHWCLIAPSCIYEAALLLILSLMAMEYGWLYGRTLGLHDKLYAGGVSPLMLYLAHMAVWAGVVGWPCLAWMSYIYGWHVGMALALFVVTPLTWLALFLWHGGARLFHYLIIFIPLQLPYFLLLQGVVDQEHGMDPLMAMAGAACVSLALVGLSLPGVPAVVSSAWQYCYATSETEDASVVCS